VVYPPYLPFVDSMNHLVQARRLRRRLADAGTLWVVAAAASYGYGAVCSRRPYAAWIGTGLESEWAASRPGLTRARRLALGLNAPLLRRLERRVLRGATRLYATSAASRGSVARAAGLPEDRVGVLPIPVDVDGFRPGADEEWVGGLDRPVVVFVGRGDDPRKNLGLLLDAWPSIRRELPEVRLRLAGRPPSGSLPQGVEALGEVSSVADVLRSASLFVLPSRQEGFGIVAAEALASGVPVVTTPCGGPEELVRESGAGVVLPTFEVEALAATVVDLLRDRDRLLLMRATGRAHVEREHAPRVLRDRLAPILEDLGGG